MAPRAFGLNCTLTPSPKSSSTQKMLDQVLGAITAHGFETSHQRLVDLDIRPGVAANAAHLARLLDDSPYPPAGG